MNTNQNPIRWGIIGCGRIAGKFCSSMAVVPDGTITACASRTPGKAASFAEQHNIPHDFDDYVPMLESDLVDAVYIATTHNFHHANMLLCIDHGKHVLCEKPLTVTAQEAEEAIAKAREKNVFLMEAMWTRFLPAIQRMKALLDDGAIGEVKMVRADFCYRAPFDPENRLFNPDLAGGAYLDAGIYPVSMASFVMGSQPRDIKVVADIGKTGVDEQSAYLFDYRDGRIAVLSSAMASPSRNRLEIAGTEGLLVVPEWFLGAQKLELHKGGKVEAEEYPFPDPEGFRFQIEAAHACIRNGETECAVMPLAETLAIAQTMDAIRSQFP